MDSFNFDTVSRLICGTIRKIIQSRVQDGD